MKNIITANTPIALDEAPEVTGRLKFDQRDVLMTYLLRNTVIFLDARRELKREHFTGQGETALGVLWAVLLEQYKRYGMLPTKPQLEAEVLAVLEDDGDRYTPEMKLDVANLIATAHEMEPEVLSTNEQYGRDLLCQFLLERAVMDPMSAFVNNAKLGVLKNPMRDLDRMRGMVSNVEALRSYSATSLVQPGWKPKTQVQVPVGIPWMDLALDGGQTVGQVYGVFGPFGSFKTGICVQIGVATAKTQYTIAAATEGKPRLTVYVVYEGGEDAIMLRALGCAAKIPRKRLLHHYLGTGALSTDRTNLQPYEVARYAGMPAAAQVPEIDRLEEAKTCVANFHILDMSGSAKNPHAGSGYIDEIVTSLERVRQSTGQEIGTVIIDYAKLMARRHLHARGLPYEHMRFLVGQIPDVARRDIGERFGCVVWIAQQLNTAANKKSAGSAQHHADSSEAGDFGENVWYAFTLSAVDKKNDNSVQFNATKTRDSAGLSEPIILKIAGDQECLVDASSTYTRGSQGQIVTRTVAGTMVPLSPPAENGSGSAAVDGVPTGDPPRAPRRPGQVGYTPPTSSAG